MANGIALLGGLQKGGRAVSQDILQGLQLRQQQLQQEIENERAESTARFNKNMQLFNSLRAAGADTNTLSEFAQKQLAPDADGILDDVDFGNKAAVDFLAKAHANFEKTGDIEMFGKTLQLGLTKFPRAKEAFQEAQQEVAKAEREQQLGMVPEGAAGPETPLAAQLTPLGREQFIEGGPTAVSAVGAKKGPAKPLVQNVIQGERETALEKAYGKERGEFLANTAKEVDQAAKAADRTLMDLKQLEGFLDKVRTGALAPTTLQVNRFAQAFGIEIDKNVGAAEAIEALSNEMALKFRNPATGAGMPGAMSDKDREFLVSIVPGLAKTPAGNKLIIASRRKQAERDVEIGKFTRDFIRKNKRITEEYFEELANKFSAKPLFNIPDDATLVPGKATRDGLPVYQLANGKLWTPDF